MILSTRYLGHRKLCESQHPYEWQFSNFDVNIDFLLYLNFKAKENYRHSNATIRFFDFIWTTISYAALFEIAKPPNTEVILLSICSQGNLFSLTSIQTFSYTSLCGTWNYRLVKLCNYFKIYEISVANL